MSNDLMIEFRLHGPMRIGLRCDNEDLVLLDIPSAKARGLLALLVRAPGMSRARSWLRDMLWSDRGRAQASASLRQEILNLIRLHPVLDGVLLRSRKTVWLSRARVSVVAQEDTTDTGMFLEDLDVQDPAFQQWLGKERRAEDPSWRGVPLPFVSRPETQNRRRVLTFKTSTPSQDPNSFLETMLSHFVGQSLGEHIMIDVIDVTKARGLPEVTWVEIHAVPRDTLHSVVRVSVRDGPRKTLIWSDLQNIPGEDLLEINHPRLLSYCNQLVLGILDALALRQPANPDEIETGLIAHLATRKVFSMDPAEIRSADKLLEIANSRGSRGVYLAWRALVRSFQLIERHGGDTERLRHEVQQMSFQALEMEPMNSMVLALVANARLAMGDNVVACKELAERSVRLNPSNPMSWDSLSIAKLYMNDYQGAHNLAIRAQEVSVGTPHSFWWDMGRSISAASIGLLDEAIHFAELSQARSPQFRPPKRYLAGLYSVKGWDEKVIACVQSIKLQEPQFEPLQLAEDPDYPSSILRLSGLVNADLLRNLG